MSKVTGSISLATVRVIKGIVPLRGTFTVQMLSTNLSGDTTLNLQFSLDGTNWDNAQEQGTDVSDTLIDDTVLIKSFEADPSLNWQIIFAGVTTGTVNYIVNAV